MYAASSGSLLEDGCHSEAWRSGLDRHGRARYPDASSLGDMSLIGSSAQGRWGELLRPPFLLPAATLCLGEGIYALNTFLVSTALPSAVLELHGVGLISWAFTFYLTAAIVGGACGGLLKQVLGARAALAGAAALFALGTVIAAAAGSMPQVLIGRLLQGAGEGVIAALCYALAAELFPRALIPKAFGALAVMWASAAFGGPMISGLLTELISWRAAFLVNIPLILLFLLLLPRAVPRGRSTAYGDGRARLPGIRLCCIALGITSIASAGQTASLFATVPLILLAVALLAASVMLDRRSVTRLFPHDAFRIRSTVGAALWVVLLMPSAQAAVTVYLPLFLQTGWQWRPTYAGAAVALLALSWSGSAILVANITAGDWPRTFIRLGPVFVTVALLAQAAAMFEGWPWLVILAQLVLGAGFGINWGFISQAVMEAAIPTEKDRASGLLPTVQSAGYAIGAAVAGVIAHLAGLGDRLDAEIVEQVALWIFGLHSLIALPAILLAHRVRFRQL